MSVTPIEAIGASDFIQLDKTAGAGKADFADWLGAEINSVNQNIEVADQAVRDLAVGEAENLHQVMISLSKAQTSFELAVQVRNRLLEGFQEIMRMSV